MTFIEKCPLLLRMWSALVAFIGAVLIAAPVDWGRLEMTDFNKGNLITAVIWFVGWCAARLKSQPSVSDPHGPVFPPEQKP
jgi:hypothetical protein